MTASLVASAACTAEMDRAVPPGRSTPGPTAAPTTGAPPADADVRVPMELRFTAPALGGGTIDGADYAGSDLVVWFWAPW